jgi:hypothetical protein
MKMVKAAHASETSVYFKDITLRFSPEGYHRHYLGELRL